MNETEHDNEKLKVLINRNPLFVFAMPEEAGLLFQEDNLLFTGIGKVNAVYALTKALSAKPYSVIINLGSAGSHTYL